MATTSVRPPPAEVVGRQAIRDPDSGLLYAAVAVAVLSAIQVFVYPFGRTLSEFAIGGRELLLGGAPGKTFWSLRAPGIAFLHAAIQRVISPAAIAARAFEVLCLFGLVFVAIRLCKRFAAYERVGLIGGAIALFVHSQLEYEHTGQPELYATLLIGFAAWVATLERKRQRRFWHFGLIGLLVSIAIVFVPLFALTLVPILWWIARDERELRIGVAAPVLAVLSVLLSSAIGPSLLVLWLQRHAALRPFIGDWFLPSLHLWMAWSPESFLEWLYFTADRLLLRQSAIVPAGMLLAYGLPKLASNERRGLNLLLGLAGAELIAFALSYESNPGRLSGALPILSIIAGIGIYKLYRRLLEQGPFAIFAFASGLVFLAALCTAVDVAPGTYYYRSWIRLKYIAGLMPYRASELLEADLYSNADINLPSSRRVAALLARMRAMDGEVLVQGDDPQVLWLAKLRPATRLTRPMPEDLAAVDAELEARLSNDFEHEEPRIIVTSPAISNGKATSTARRLGYDREFLVQRYEIAATRDGWSLWTPKQ